MSRVPRVVLDTNVALPALVYVVTGDRDLLLLPGEFSCPIVSADHFLSALAKT
jgi:predicted nucleic acid-binding protein